jgi:hypothetical protein
MRHECFETASFKTSGTISNPFYMDAKNTRTIGGAMHLLGSNPGSIIVTGHSRTNKSYHTDMRTQDHTGSDRKSGRLVPPLRNNSHP